MPPLRNGSVWGRGPALSETKARSPGLNERKAINALHPLFGDQSGRATSSTSITSVAGAILVNAPTLDGWYLLRGHAGAMSRTTGIYALLFSGLSRREGARGEVGVARIECSRTR